MERSRLQRTGTFNFIRLLIGLKMLQVEKALCKTNRNMSHLSAIVVTKEIELSQVLNHCWFFLYSLFYILAFESCTNVAVTLSQCR
jgi:hypothetical protein